MAQRTCPACGTSFVPASNHQKWCGRTCYNRERQRRYLKIHPRALTRRCRYCGEMFSSPDSRRSYCGSDWKFKFYGRASDRTVDLYVVCAAI